MSRNRDTISITLEREIIDRLDAARGHAPRSRVIEDAVITWLSGREPEPEADTEL